MSSGSIVLRAQVRSHRRALAATALLCAAAGAVSLSALAGARRTDSAHDRFLDAHAVADVAVDVGDPDPTLLERTARLPDVRTLGGWEYIA